MNDNRCDAALPSGKRCKNEPDQWAHVTFQPNEETIEDWPVLLCAPCAALAEKTGEFHRLGPDRRATYAKWKARETAVPS